MFFKGDFYHLLASHGFLKGVKYSSKKRKKEEGNKKGKEDQSKWKRAKSKIERKNKFFGINKTSEPCVELL